MSFAPEYLNSLYLTATAQQLEYSLSLLDYGCFFIRASKLVLLYPGTPKTLTLESVDR